MSLYSGRDLSWPERINHGHHHIRVILRDADNGRESLIPSLARNLTRLWPSLRVWGKRGNRTGGTGLVLAHRVAVIRWIRDRRERRAQAANLIPSLAVALGLGLLGGYM